MRPAGGLAIDLNYGQDTITSTTVDRDLHQA